MNLVVCGPMTGYPSFNFPAFLETARRLRELGHDVWTAAEHELESGFKPDEHGAQSHDEYMAQDLPYICRADALVMLPGWLNSKGACLEYLVGDALGKPVYQLVDDMLLPITRKPFAVAATVVLEIERRGLRKHKHDGWAHEPPAMHAMKAARHLMTHEMIRNEYAPPDADNHLAHALCRVAMALASEERHHGIPPALSCESCV